MVKKLNIETEQKILQAARKVLISKGKNGARMQEIADVAGVNKALLHYYFRSKEKLYTEVLRGVVKQILESVVMKIDPKASIKTFLKEFISNHINFIKNNLPLIRFFLGEISINQKQIGLLMKEHLKLDDQPAHKVIAQKINKAVLEGQIIPIDPTNLIINMLSLNIFFFIVSPFIHTVLESSPEKKEKILTERADHVFDFVWNSIKKK